MTRTRLRITVTGGSLRDRLRLRLAVLRLRIAFRDLTDDQIAVFLDGFVSRAQEDGLDVQWRWTR